MKIADEIVFPFLFRANRILLVECTMCCCASMIKYQIVRAAFAGKLFRLRVVRKLRLDVVKIKSKCIHIGMCNGMRSNIRLGENFRWTGIFVFFGEIFHSSCSLTQQNDSNELQLTSECNISSGRHTIQYTLTAIDWHRTREIILLTEEHLADS